jgi:hypothetical protein
VRDIRRFVANMTPAMLTVGGHFDTDDLQGPW